MKDSKPVFKVASVYDTETTNLQTDNGEWHAFPILFIFNDIRNVDISKYVIDESDDVRFMRRESDALEYIDELINDGISKNYIPIICAYNLMFDLQPIIHSLSKRYDIQANAQSSTNVYTLDLFRDDRNVLRFWDTYHLEMNGLDAMGRICGVRKASGKWDYDKIRTPETELTDAEFEYAKRDVQVIPAFLRYICDTNELVDPSDLGVSVITKTSLVRITAKKKIGGFHFTNSHGTRVSLKNAFEWTCRQELPSDYMTYALRKACFRGGFTFIAGRTAMRVMHNVASLDVTSMHHQFINGRMVPVHFKKVRPYYLKGACESVLNTPFESVLDNYALPFTCAFHVRICFNNIRLKGCFKEYGIGLIPQSKFHLSSDRDDAVSVRNSVADDDVRSHGFRDSALNPVFAFGKLYSAKKCILHVCEIELYALSLVYEWDSYTPILGEATSKFTAAPDYVTLQSHMYYSLKSAMKQVCKTYEEGIPYEGDTSLLPSALARSLCDGTAKVPHLNAYYTSTVKGMFNGVYGTQAQDIYRPSYICDDGKLVIDDETRCTPESFTNEDKKNVRVLYTYGMRIVGGSRLHLVIAILLLHERLKGGVSILAGDTDSLKVACCESIGSNELLDALSPLHVASTRAREFASRRVRRCFREQCVDLGTIGHFEVENDGHFYTHHIELWNKARISVDSGCAHVTCAGLPRPDSMYNIENMLNDLNAVYDWDVLLNVAIGYNTYADHSICHSLQRTAPNPSDVFDGSVCDHLGKTSHVRTHESIALYPCGRWLGEESKAVNSNTLDWMHSNGFDVNSEFRSLRTDGTRCYIEFETSGSYSCDVVKR